MSETMCAQRHTAPVPRRSPIADASAWRSADLADDPRWIRRLGPSELAEIETALARAADRKLQIPFDRKDFEAPAVAAFLQQAAAELDHGCGVQLIRGLPRAELTDAECALVYWGMGVQLGRPVSQNARGDLLGHVRDEGKSIEDPSVRSYQTRGRLDFHADKLPVDVLGLLCLRTARSGGTSRIVSATAIHDVILDERPDLLEVLYRPFTLDWRDEEPVGEAPWYRLPMFSECGGKVTSRFTTIAYFHSAVRHGAEHAITPEQDEALQFAQEVANRPEMQLAMDFEEGDVQLLNNHVTLHARDAFEDHPEPERKRHLLRLWISYPPERRRPVSPLLAERLKLVDAGGIPVSA